MDFVILEQFDNYIDAHIVKGRLEDQNIVCFLQNENVSSLIVDPILTNAFGGIRLMVAKDQLSIASEILNQSPQNFMNAGS